MEHNPWSDGPTQPNHYPEILVSLYRVRLAVAIRTIDGPVATGFKRHLGVFAASSAFDVEHLARSGAVASAAVAIASAAACVLRCFPCISASRAALRLVGIASGRKLFLFISAESEGSGAIGTRDGFVLITHWMTSFFKI